MVILDNIKYKLFTLVGYYTHIRNNIYKNREKATESIPIQTPSVIMTPYNLNNKKWPHIIR